LCSEENIWAVWGNISILNFGNISLVNRFVMWTHLSTSELYEWPSLRWVTQFAIFNSICSFLCLNKVWTCMICVLDQFVNLCVCVWSCLHCVCAWLLWKFFGNCNCNCRPNIANESVIKCNSSMWSFVNKYVYFIHCFRSCLWTQFLYVYLLYVLFNCLTKYFPTHKRNELTVPFYSDDLNEFNLYEKNLKHFALNFFLSD
jgi:hypothetical protein